MAETVVIVGAGPKLGAALGRRFAREGASVALLARNPDTIHAIEGSVRHAAGEGPAPGRIIALPCDASDAQGVIEAFGRIRDSLGAATVLVYNAGAFQRGGVLTLAPDRVEQTWRVACLGALVCAQQVLPDMVKTKRGTILLTGATASLRGSSGFASFAMGKFGLRALGQSMAREFGPLGIHVAHVVIDGQIGAARPESALKAENPARSSLDPDALAEVYWQLHRQDPTTWSFEIDVRPAVEEF